MLEDSQSGLFGYTFPLIFEFSGRATQVGDVTLFSSREVVLSRIMVSIYFLIGNAMIKTTFLIILFLMAFRRLLTDPLSQLTEQIESLQLDELEGQHVEVATEDRNELKVMEESFNKLIDKVVQYRKELDHTQKELIVSNEKLDQQNVQLEQDVARKTSNLSQAMIKLQQQKGHPCLVCRRRSGLPASNTPVERRAPRTTRSSPRGESASPVPAPAKSESVWRCSTRGWPEYPPTATPLRGGVDRR